MIQQALAEAGEPQVVAGDFNATRDHGSFRELLAAGLVDCADVSQNRSWLGFTWPARRRALPVLRLDHVLVSPAHRRAGTHNSFLVCRRVRLYQETASAK